MAVAQENGVLQRLVMEGPHQGMRYLRPLQQ
jgi:hypothetical protein